MAKLSKDTALLAELVNDSVDELRKSGAIPRLTEHTLAILGYGIPPLSRPAKSAKAELKKLSKALNAPNTQLGGGSKLTGYWEAFNACSQLVTAIDIFLSDERKRQNVQ